MSEKTRVVFICFPFVFMFETSSTLISKSSFSSDSSSEVFTCRTSLCFRLRLFDFSLKRQTVAKSFVFLHTRHVCPYALQSSNLCFSGLPHLVHFVTVCFGFLFPGGFLNGFDLRGCLLLNRYAWVPMALTCLPVWSSFIYRNCLLPILLALQIFTVLLRSKSSSLSSLSLVFLSWRPITILSQIISSMSVPNLHDDACFLSLFTSSSVPSSGPWVDELNKCLS